ncbi:SMP-30/gluconolactonase/LRE family protein [Intrasporangium flavum]|uniref:SMP-30/gluconolactonase/LRE family protein n=1 Tax=Intrasporangium flavum TaxID=1428657 RepID=UPI00096C8C81|nr:SMP-30/gluconolactonase/LRE family protein [Intrasporangium flavum]
MRGRVGLSLVPRAVAPAVAGAVVCAGLVACSAAVPGPSADASATSSSTRPAGTPPASTSAPGATQTTAVTSSPPAPTPTALAPRGYRTSVVHHGADHPDDLALDPTGALLYSDYTNGTVTRLAADGSTRVVHRGLDGPEGLVQLSDGTLVVAEENTNRVLSFAAGRSAPRVLATLPGQPVKATCRGGVDGIAWDATTLTLIVPDPVTGTIYRLAPQGGSLTPLARGFVHPVGAAVDSHGRVYVADECGGDVWRLGAGGSRTRVARASMPDDLAFDAAGALLVTDVRHVNHDLRRWPAGGGAPTVLARSGLVEPQGLLVTPNGDVYVSDDQADVILRLVPV